MIYLISIEDFKRKADISQNLHTDKLKACIGIVQEQYAVKILCQDLYDEIIDQTETPPMSEYNTELLPYVKDFLIYKAYARYTVGGNLLATAAGFRVAKNDIDDPASSAEMENIRSLANQDANFYQERLVNFLIKNVDNYPLWKNSICNCGKDLRPQGMGKISAIGSTNSVTPIKWT
jgi:hypothetical protein